MNKYIVNKNNSMYICTLKLNIIYNTNYEFFFK